MKIAIPTWQGRISPVFDVFTNVLLVEITHRQEQSRQLVALDSPDPEYRVQFLRDRGVDVLVCCAISKPVELELLAKGIDVIPRVCGDVEHVLAGFIKGDLNEQQFGMPGCCGRQTQTRQRQRGCCHPPRYQK
ncbi:MAG: NifB/NifX family molybdenum-iron cluster-binding protein [Phycisphaerales bacterium]|nr:NifB/NifX family molybdenum-iron cluster-binding protein [Phycisphaerales bacterium]MBT7172013.1 NifB/NifX family molybdenum-iron cluster-binding protein [Phycisphaerales bacterium]